MRIKLSKTRIADAILHNNVVPLIGGNRMGVFLYGSPPTRAEIHEVDRGTYYSNVKIADPREFVTNIPDDDTIRWWFDAYQTLISEGRVQDHEVTGEPISAEETEMINDLAELYEAIWRENLVYPPSIGEIEIEWID